MKTLQIGPMTTLMQRAVRVGLGLGLAATLAFSAVMPASADTGTGTVVLTGGTLSATIGDFSFPATTLTGAAQVKTAAPPIAVVDPTGSSAGWNVTMSATAFADGGTTPKTLVAAPRVTAAPITDDNNGNAGHTNGVSYASPVSITGAGGKIASSAANSSSNGTFTLTPTIAIDIPANSEVATYTSTITVTIASAP